MIREALVPKASEMHVARHNHCLAKKTKNRSERTIKQVFKNLFWDRIKLHQTIISFFSFYSVALTCTVSKDVINSIAIEALSVFM